MFACDHTFNLKKLPNERSYKFRRILTTAEVMDRSYKKLKSCAHETQ